MQITYELQLADWRASNRFFAERRKPAGSASRGWWFYRFWFLLFLLPMVISPLRYLGSSEFKNAWKATGVVALWPLGIIFIPLGALAILWFGAPLLQNLAFRDSPFYNRQFTLSIEEDGIDGDIAVLWAQMQAVEESRDHIFVVFDNDSVLVIPKRAFESETAATQFAARCRDGRQKI